MIRRVFSLALAVICQLATLASAQAVDLQTFAWQKKPQANAVSADGVTVIGTDSRTDYGYYSNGEFAFYWTKKDGFSFLPQKLSDETFGRGISPDGRVFVGQFEGKAFRWMEGKEDLFRPLPAEWKASSTVDASFNGNFIVGYGSPKAKVQRAFRWSINGDLRTLKGPNGANSRATAVSYAGDVVVGDFDSNDGGTRPFRWTGQGDQVTPLGTLGATARRVNSEALDVSPDGRIVVGMELYDVGGNQAWYWSKAAGMTALPDGQSIDSRANGINVDGSVIVGHIDGVATVWLSGVPYPLAYLLASSGIDVSQLEFHELTDCSRSGRIVVGYGFDAAVGNVAFRAELPLYNRPPSASAGRNQSVRTADKKGAWVDLDGSRSSDPDEDGLRYRWSAPKVRFEDREVQKTRAFFPLGTTKVTLSVKDESDLTDSDTIRVTVRRAGGKDEADFVIE